MIKNSGNSQRKWQFKNIQMIILLILGFISFGIGQGFYTEGESQGIVHYVNYDDYQEEEQNQPQNPILSMKPTNKVWNEDVMYIPELILEDPNPREGTSSLPLNQPPGGGTKRGMVFYSAFPGRSNLMRWKVIHPIVNGNCTIKLSNGLDQTHSNAFQPLTPVFDFSYQNKDGSLDYYSGDQENYYRNFFKNGKFSCGRVDPGTYESITVQFPNMTCEDGILQMEVETKQGKIYQGADIEVINTEMKDCIGTCENEGVCVNGKCLCRSGFLGDHCQTKTQEKRTYTPWFAIVGLIIFAIIVAVVGYISLQFVSQKESWVSQFGNSRKSKHYPLEPDST